MSVLFAGMGALPSSDERRGRVKTPLWSGVHARRARGGDQQWQPLHELADARVLHHLPNSSLQARLATEGCAPVGGINVRQRLRGRGLPERRQAIKKGSASDPACVAAGV